MSIAIEHREITPEELLAMPDGKNYELVDGELVERNMGWNASLVAGNVYARLRPHCDGEELGLVVPADASYQCFPDAPKKVRRPDVSFVKKERVPPSHERQGHCRVAPDMATEVISPNDSYVEVEEKVHEYLTAGVQLVWVINPQRRTVRIHRGDGSVADLAANGELTGEDVIPGFRVRVIDLFEGVEPEPPTVTARNPEPLLARPIR